MTAHIRRKALARGPYQTRDTYGPFDGDPQRKTLCGEPPTITDMTWAETRFPKARVFVSCETCLAARLDSLSLSTR